MKISQEDKDKVLALLNANPKATTLPIFHSTIVSKTGLTSPKVTAIRKELLEAGKIREEHLPDHPIAVFLVIKDKRQQILDLIAEAKVSDADLLQRYLGIPKEQLCQLCLQLSNAGLIDIYAMLVRPSRNLLAMSTSRPQN